jgi:ATP-dependent protease ClpP protease subunit
LLSPFYCIAANVAEGRRPDGASSYGGIYAMDVPDQKSLERQGIVLIRANIDRDLENALSMLVIDKMLTVSPLILLIDCLGGDVQSAIHLYDLIYASPIESVAIVFGECTSAAMLLLMACKKRLALKHARFRCHNMFYSKRTPLLESSRPALAKVLDNQLGLSRSYDDILCSNGLKPKTLQRLKAEGEIGLQFEANLAIKYGLIDQTIDDLSPYIQPRGAA